mgnify:CR=1 FL=1
MFTVCKVIVDHDKFDLAGNHETACMFGTSWRGAGLYFRRDFLVDAAAFGKKGKVVPEAGKYLDRKDLTFEYAEHGIPHEYVQINHEVAEKLYRAGWGIRTFCLDHKKDTHGFDFTWDRPDLIKSTLVSQKTVQEAFDKMGETPEWWVWQEILKDNGDSVCWDAFFQIMDYGEVIYG